MKSGRLGKKSIALLLCMTILLGSIISVNASELGNLDANLTVSTESTVTETTEVTETTVTTEVTEATETTETTETTEVTEVIETTEATEVTETTESTEVTETTEATEKSEKNELAEKDEKIQNTCVRFDYKSDLVNVMVTLGDEKDLPENAELVVNPVEVTEEMQSTIAEAVESQGTQMNSILAFDISFVADGVEVEPGATVKVQITLPEVTCGDSVSVFHYDETTDEAENMQAEVSEDGTVAFDTPHFSTYVIVNEGKETVTVTIEHINSSTGKKIYADDVRKLASGARINDYKKANNWNVHKVAIIEDGEEKILSNTDEIELYKDATIKVYYEAASNTIEGDTTFFDYVVKPVQSGWFNKNGDYSEYWKWGYEYKAVDKPEWSINTAANYADSNSGMEGKRLTSGTKSQNYEANQYDANITVNGIQKNANTYTSGEDGLITGLVSGMSDDFTDVLFTLDEPGFFSLEDKAGKTILNDYTLSFERTGDTYRLSTVKDLNGSVVASAGSDFFPLDDAASNVTDNGYGNSHNYFFGMRYDVLFTLGDYVGPLNYSFTGDDDLWVILDGKQVVIDLGGIHDALSAEVNLWKALGLEEGIGATTEEAKNAEHRLTILYMERGGNASNCQMYFTIPSAEIVSVTSTTTNLTLNKANTSDEPLAGAAFKLVNDATGNAVSAVSEEDGTVTFRNLKVGTYTLSETVAPDGYTATTETWKVKVTAEAEEIVAKVYLADGTTELKEQKIVNLTSQEYLNQNLEYAKTAALTNWEDRTYAITITAASKATAVSTTTDNIDVMMVFDLSGSMNKNINGGTSPDMIKVGKYSSVKDSLNTKQIYYFKSKNKITPPVSGPSCSYAPYPMKYIDGQWKYYDNGWKSIGDYANDNVYTWDSRLSALKEAASSFVTNMSADAPESKIGIASFYGYKTDQGNDTTGTVNQSLTTVSENPFGLLETINALLADGGTSPQKALTLLDAEFGKANDTNEKYIILFSDGNPSSDTDKKDTETEIAKLKASGNNYTIITVGFGLTDTTAKWLGGLATSEKWAYTASTADELKKIFQNLQQTLVENAAITGAQVTDVLDTRFALAEGEEERLKALYGENVSIVENEDGTITITWQDQVIKHKTEGGWSAELHIVAKDTFIGGNNIPTNVSPDSCISTSEAKVVLPQPKVNVKADFVVNNVKNTIFLGESISTDEELLKAVFDSDAVTGVDGTVFENTDASRFTLTWYEDTDLTDIITVEEMGNVVPVSVDDSKEYYLHVTYDAGEATEESNSNSTLDGVTYIAGEADYMVEAINSADSNLNYGIYTTDLIDGTIVITKTIPEGSYKKIQGDPVFTFKITNTDTQKVYYRTLRFKNADTTELTATVAGLRKGHYLVEELDTIRYDLTGLSVVAEDTNCAYKAADANITFAIGYKDAAWAGTGYVLSKADNITGQTGSVIFTNEKKDESRELTDTDVVKNSFVIGEKTSSTKDADNK